MKMKEVNHGRIAINVQALALYKNNHYIQHRTTTMLESYVVVLLLGVFYGFFVGLIPVAGATTGLIAIYSFVTFQDPIYVSCIPTAIVVIPSIGDSFCGVVMNISGAGGALPTMVDGFPMSRRGEAARVPSAAISTSWVNGLVWGPAVFLFLVRGIHKLFRILVQ